MTTTVTMVTWQGRPAPESLVRRLREAGITLDARPRATGRVLVTRTAGGRQAPRVEATTPWIWIADAEIAASAARAAVLAGAYDALSLTDADFDIRLLARLRELSTIEPPPPATPGIIAESPAARAMLAQVWRVARTNMPVLLVGETGSGKEEMAALVHRWSSRDGPYVPINCAAIPNELMESELFGHAKGAFSGAVASVDGKLTAARGGTVFLDEIDDTPLSTQAKLLRVLEDGQVTRLGETRPQRVDFRIVAATNRDLQALIARGRFGQDLYERLAIVTVRLPRLRERCEDIPALAMHFVARFYERLGVTPRVRAVAASALAAFQEYDWPGNIRELRNVVYQALVYKRAGDELLLSDVPTLLRPARGSEPLGLVDAAAIRAQLAAGTFNLCREIEALERLALGLALERTHGNAARAARLLGAVGRGAAADPGGTVRAMMRRLGVASPLRIGAP
jgi:DNA-binding NtrC family response regulator